MLEAFISRFSDRFLSRWLVLTIDLFIVGCTIPVAILLRLNFELVNLSWSLLLTQTTLTLALYLIGFLLTKSYSGIIRHTGTQDALRILGASAIAFLLGMAMVIVFRFVNAGVFSLSLSILVINIFLALVALIGFRFSVKTIFQQVLQGRKLGRTRVLIYGAGASGIITRNTLGQDMTRIYDVVGFIDDHSQKWGKRVDGIPVFPPSILNEENIADLRVHQLIIAIQRLEGVKKKEIIELGIELGMKVKVVPAIRNWIQGNLTISQIKKVRIEDLLEREPISLDSENVRNYVQGRTIFVTGAAGSIGSEIARQIMHYGPKRVVFIDQAESPLHDLEVSIRASHPRLSESAEFVIADITHEVRMRQLFAQYRPDTVFHAAAYKHVPMMEAYPFEAVRVNVWGTRCLADLSVEFGVSRFVMVSTDKAVNPTNVMGASKRMAEMYTQSLNGKGRTTHFITTRFGNVLGSNGSVIPLFRRQIESGGPITVTHVDITRYFMTIPEACNLVLEAGAMGKGGEIFVFDMGESVKVIDLARKMIRLSGLQPDIDIEIKVTGLRPGEKLYEELLADKESTKPTHHPKIMIASVRTAAETEMLAMMDEMAKILKDGNPIEVVRTLKKHVPEFVSNNSEFAFLDKERTGLLA
jgi:FlaA1/EpsC-like NDP-sugar epimerase